MEGRLLLTNVKPISFGPNTPSSSIDILIDADGKIAEFGPSLNVHGDVRRVDGKGAWISPGLGRSAYAYLARRHGYFRAPATVRRRARCDNHRRCRFGRRGQFPWISRVYHRSGARTYQGVFKLGLHRIGGLQPCQRTQRYQVDRYRSHRCLRQREPRPHRRTEGTCQPRDHRLLGRHTGQRLERSSPRF